MAGGVLGRGFAGESARRLRVLGAGPRPVWPHAWLHVKGRHVKLRKPSDIDEGVFKAVPATSRALIDSKAGAQPPFPEVVLSAAVFQADRRTWPERRRGEGDLRLHRGRKNWRTALLPVSAIRRRRKDESATLRVGSICWGPFLRSAFAFN
jgi:hypothetical protein